MRTLSEVCGTFAVVLMLGLNWIWSGSVPRVCLYCWPNMPFADFAGGARFKSSAEGQLQYDLDKFKFLTFAMLNHLKAT